MVLPTGCMQRQGGEREVKALWLPEAPQLLLCSSQQGLPPEAESSARLEGPLRPRSIHCCCFTRFLQLGPEGGTLPRPVTADRIVRKSYIRLRRGAS